MGGDETGVGAAHQKGVALPVELDQGPEFRFNFVQPYRRDVAPGSYVVGVDGQGEGGGHGICCITSGLKVRQLWING